MNVMLSERFLNFHFAARGESISAPALPREINPRPKVDASKLSGNRVSRLAARAVASIGLFSSAFAAFHDRAVVSHPVITPSETIMTILSEAFISLCLTNRDQVDCHPGKG